MLDAKWWMRMEMENKETKMKRKKGVLKRVYFDKGRYDERNGCAYVAENKSTADPC